MELPHAKVRPSQSPDPAPNQRTHSDAATEVDLTRPTCAIAARDDDSVWISLRPLAGYPLATQSIRSLDRAQ